MSLGHLIGRMIGAGMSPEEAGAIAAEIYAAGVASASVRSSGAERTRRWRENKASQNVTERHIVTFENVKQEPSQTVTNRHKPSQCDAATVLHRDTNLKKDSMRHNNRASRGTRLSPDWSPTGRDRAAAEKEGLSAREIDKEALRFRDYWIGRAGSGGVKLDWSATWRNWVRTAAERLGKAPLSSSSDAKPTGFLAEFGSAELEAWDAYGKTVLGKTFPRNKEGGWRFPTRWPPGYVPKGAESTAENLEQVGQI